MKREDVNPFVRHLNLNTWQKLQVIIMSVTVAPIRFVLLLMLFAIAWSLARIFTIGSDTTKPAGPIRLFLYKIMQKLGRVMMFICGFHYVKVNGKQASRDEAAILLAVPHSSFWDVIIVFITSPMPSAISKVENFHIPIFGTIMKCIQPLLVSRSDTTSKHHTFTAIKDRLSLKKPWPQLVIFPEGTCTNRKCIINFKLGAFVSGKQIQPVVLRYRNSPDVTTWTEVGPRALYLIWLSLCQLQLNVEIDFLPVYTPSVEEKADPKLFALNVQKYLSRVCTLKCSDHSYEDKVLMKYAGKLKLPKQKGCIQFLNLSKTLAFKFDGALDRLKEFAAMCLLYNHTSVSFEAFVSFFNFSDSSIVRKLFYLVKPDGNTLSFSDYIKGYYTLANCLKAEPMLTSAYEEFCMLKTYNKSNSKDYLAIKNVATKFFQGFSLCKETFADFAIAHPFHCKLVLLLSEDTPFVADSCSEGKLHKRSKF